MGKVIKRLLKTIIIVAVLMYFGVVMAKQEIQFRKYDNDIKEYNSKIAEETLRHEQLIDARKEISSSSYIEEVAREKLGLVMPNEIVFIDASL